MGVDYNARLYDPAIGRFLSTDPLIAHPGSTQSINPYSYVENNPLNRTDPTGQSSTMCGGSMAKVCGLSTKDVQNVTINSKTGQVTATLTNGKTVSGNVGSVQAGAMAAGAVATFGSSVLGTVAKNSAGNTSVNKHQINNKITAPFPSETASKADVSGKAASVPDSIKVHGHYHTPKDAAYAVMNKYGAIAKKHEQELQAAIVKIRKGKYKGRWGYLTPGWGPKGANDVSTKALVAAYQAAGFTSGIWIHSHFNNTNFSAVDFALVWTKSAPESGTGPITFMFDANMHLHELTDAYLHAKYNALGFYQKRLGLKGLQQVYWENGLPGIQP